LFDLKPRPRGVTFLGYLYYIAGIFAILSGIDGFLDIIVFFSPSLTDILGSSVLIDVDNITPTERMISDIHLGAELILGPFYIIVGYGLLRLRPRAIELKLVLAIIGLTNTVIAEILLLTIHPDELFGVMITMAIEIAIDVLIIAYLHKPSIRQYFKSHSYTNS
jgi:hypothetical protein